MTETAEQIENILIIRKDSTTTIVGETFKGAVNLREILAAEIAMEILKLKSKKSA